MPAEALIRLVYGRLGGETMPTTSRRARALRPCLRNLIGGLVFLAPSRDARSRFASPALHARVAHRVNEFTSSDDPSTCTSAALRLPNACKMSSRGEPATVTVLGPLRTGVTAPP